MGGGLTVRIVRVDRLGITATTEGGTHFGENTDIGLFMYMQIAAMPHARVVGPKSELNILHQPPRGYRALVYERQVLGIWTQVAAC